MVIGESTGSTSHGIRCSVLGGPFLKLKWGAMTGHLILPRIK